jgi:hypothetical protein
VELDDAEELEAGRTELELAAGLGEAEELNVTMESPVGVGGAEELNVEGVELELAEGLGDAARVSEGTACRFDNVTRFV